MIAGRRDCLKIASGSCLMNGSHQTMRRLLSCLHHCLPRLHRWQKLLRWWRQRCPSANGRSISSESRRASFKLTRRGASQLVVRVYRWQRWDRGIQLSSHCLKSRHHSRRHSRRYTRSVRAFPLLSLEEDDRRLSSVVSTSTAWFQNPRSSRLRRRSTSSEGTRDASERRGGGRSKPVIRLAACCAYLSDFLCFCFVFLSNDIDEWPLLLNAESVVVRRTLLVSLLAFSRAILVLSKLLQQIIRECYVRRSALPTAATTRIVWACPKKK